MHRCRTSCSSATSGAPLLARLPCRCRQGEDCDDRCAAVIAYVSLSQEQFTCSRHTQATVGHLRLSSRPQHSNTSGSSYRGRDGRSYRSDKNKSDPFSSRRPPPIEEDFEVVGSKRGVQFEEARQAYKDAARKTNPDAEGDPEFVKRISAALDRVRRSYGC